MRIFVDVDFRRRGFLQTEQVADAKTAPKKAAKCEFFFFLATKCRNSKAEMEHKQAENTVIQNTKMLNYRGAKIWRGQNRFAAQNPGDKQRCQFSQTQIFTDVNFCRREFLQMLICADADFRRSRFSQTEQVANAKTAPKKAEKCDFFFFFLDGISSS